ncbi:MAG TPA: ribose-5-phosphate isomerase RpiA [Candidatus Cybelea sp.]|jgi:ribose 5-phosphate isomerase A|nr:ribose-5-phosphate isomerase RpiA [Candidatus Cybelea sp.]
MGTFENDDPAKRAAGFAAVDRFVRDGTCLGLGTGSTAYWAIRRVGERIAAGENIVAVATSSETEMLCRQLGIPLFGLLERPMDVAIDGADEVAPEWSLTKGGGGALFREKAVALSVRCYVIVVTESKLVGQLGAFPLPVEVVPFAAAYVRREIERRFAGLQIARREILDGQPFITDNGNWIFDCRFGAIDDPPHLDADFREIHGVVATGLFYDMVTDVLIGNADGSVRALERA